MNKIQLNGVTDGRLEHMAERQAQYMPANKAPKDERQFDEGQGETISRAFRNSSVSAPAAHFMTEVSQNRR
jgi:hypothetical protein